MSTAHHASSDKNTQRLNELFGCDIVTSKRASMDAVRKNIRIFQKAIHPFHVDDIEDMIIEHRSWYCARAIHMQCNLHQGGEHHVFIIADDTSLRIVSPIDGLEKSGLAGMTISLSSMQEIPSRTTTIAHREDMWNDAQQRYHISILSDGPEKVLITQSYIDTIREKQREKTASKEFIEHADSLVKQQHEKDRVQGMIDRERVIQSKSNWDDFTSLLTHTDSSFTQDQWTPHGPSYLVNDKRSHGYFSQDVAFPEVNRIQEFNHTSDKNVRGFVLYHHDRLAQCLILHCDTFKESGDFYEKILDGESSIVIYAPMTVLGEPGDITFEENDFENADGKIDVGRHTTTVFHGGDGKPGYQVELRLFKDKEGKQYLFFNPSSISDEDIQLNSNTPKDSPDDSDYPLAWKQFSKYGFSDHETAPMIDQGASSLMELVGRIKGQENTQTGIVPFPYPYSSDGFTTEALKHILVHEFHYKAKDVKRASKKNKQNMIQRIFSVGENNLIEIYTNKEDTSLIGFRKISKQ